VTPLPIAEPGEEGWLRRLAGGCSRPLTLTDLAYKFIGGMSGSPIVVSAEGAAIGVACLGAPDGAYGAGTLSRRQSSGVAFGRDCGDHRRMTRRDGRVARCGPGKRRGSIERDMNMHLEIDDTNRKRLENICFATLTTSLVISWTSLNIMTRPRSMKVRAPIPHGSTPKSNCVARQSRRRRQCI
jgi:hypothetical protein